ncbi:acylneuraminate cytidylyltransferase family protein [Bacillus sp. 31A1R]|uniref:Acylneuraminate cytidylyltransferase family protein n=1 Tax=Robertmurraya mangrovi TaxID=3098077 RepID=A0ABU5IXZ3_9BACI|nr:acylneuraminate cytidylyltransferase family protein [Bacillus sp. 31A1R]MDZ5471967.1 acylneuraminate cytidylyltransferase family protein [Bacillus sp. 31A1R]
MINEKKVLAVIPARGGSKGVPKKNIKLLNSKPLIAWTIEEARRSQYIDKLIVSSDDDEIIRISEEWGAEAPFKRPLELAQDKTPGMSPVLHAIEKLPGYDYIVLLQPTSPLRLCQDIDGAIELLELSGVDSCVSVTETSIPPQWLYSIDKEGFMESIFNSIDFPFQRQAGQAFYELNGAVYVATMKSILTYKKFLQEKTIPFVMPKNRSVDIDNLEDFHYCEFLLKRHKC